MFFSENCWRTARTDVGLAPDSVAQPDEAVVQDRLLGGQLPIAVFPTGVEVVPLASTSTAESSVR